MFTCLLLLKLSWQRRRLLFGVDMQDLHARESGSLVWLSHTRSLSSRGSQLPPSKLPPKVPFMKLLLRGNLRDVSIEGGSWGTHDSISRGWEPVPAIPLKLVIRLFLAPLCACIQ